MRFYLYATYLPVEQTVAVAQAAERLGFHGITIPDHVVYPFDLTTEYPYAPDPVTGRAPWDETGEWPDPFVTTAIILGATTTLTVLNGILVLPMRDPLLVAKAIATLAAFAPGRVILGAGAGWMREEFEILGFDFATRGPRSDDDIRILRKLWSGERVSHESEFRSFGDLVMLPKPPGGDVPIYIGGDAKPALRRAALLGDGILPPLSSQKKTADHLRLIGEMREEAGIDRPFDYVAAAVGFREPGRFDELVDLGVESVHVDPFQLYVRKFGGLSLEERIEALERYADEVLRPVNG